MAKDKKNPISDKDKKMGRTEKELSSDKFSKEEQKAIVRMVVQDADSNIRASYLWIEQRRKDIQMYENEKPSIIENLDKEEWMSDRNLGLTMATCDAYQATLLATCWNEDRIHFKATGSNDVDRRDNLEKFTKWMVGPNECNCFSDVDDFIHNRITQGFSVFKVYWKVWYEWVDRKIPQHDKDGKVTGYDIKTENVRFEKGVMENIDDVSDLLMPRFGDTLQSKSNLIHILHKNGDDILKLGKRGIYMNVDENMVQKLKGSYYDYVTKTLGDEKARQLGLTAKTDVNDVDLRIFPIDLYEWYGEYTKNGKTEEYRFTVDPVTNTFLAGKPLRKITSTGKRPFAGGPLIRRPGFVRGKSLPKAIGPLVNGFNNVWNQKSDFQYVENCPFGFFQPDETHKKQVYDLIPGKMYASVDPQSVNFPNLTRSQAWAESDMRVLLEMIERMTGAASYFLTNQTKDATATRDKLVQEKSENRFGLWVNRLISDISEGLTMLVCLYQENAPPDLGDRILGEDGKKLFNNLSPETLRGQYDAYLAPDIISGSKSMQREIALWGLEFLSQTVWFDPMINPKGNWGLVSDAAKKMGMNDIETLMPPEPKAQFSEGKDVLDKFAEIKQGEMPEIEEGDDIVALFSGFAELKEERYFELDPEYQPNFDVYFFNLNMAFMKYVKQVQQEKMANQIASQMIQNAPPGMQPPNAGGNGGQPPIVPPAGAQPMGGPRI